MATATSNSGLVQRLLILGEPQPPTVNQLLFTNVRRRIRLLRLWKQCVYFECLSQGLRKATGPRRVTLTVLMTPRQRGADPDAYWKATLDALVEAGMLLGDSRRHVVLAPVRYQRGCSQRGVEIVLEDLETETDVDPDTEDRAVDYDHRAR